MPENTTYNNSVEYSDEIHEIIGQIPSRVLQYGLYTFALIFVLFISLLFFVKYPDILATQVSINANNAPKSVVAHSTGKLEMLFVKENEYVKKGDVLGILESNASYQDIIQLGRDLDTAQAKIVTDKWEEIKLATKSYYQLGEVQNSYQLFYSSLLQIKSFLNQKYFIKKRNILSKNMRNTDLVNTTLLNQKELLRKDYQLADENFQAQKKLFEQRVISAAELRLEESKLLAKKNAFESIESSLINNNNNLSSYTKDQLDLEKQLMDAKYTFSENINKLFNELYAWKRKFLLISPIDGKVTFFQNVQNLQELVADEKVFFVTPQNTGVFAEAYVSQTNFGKIKSGQRVLIHLDGYPFQEYGSLIGEVSDISSVLSPNRAYLVKIKIPPNLITDYGYSIPFKNGLGGNAQIVTRRIRIIKKFYYSLNSVFEKKIDLKK